MIARLNGAKSNGMGRGFVGAGQYHLHDKKAQTQERIGVTETVNLVTKNPEMALRVMAATAMNQKELKVEAGVKNTGRKLATPVFTYSLSWHKDDKPTSEHMIEQAKETLAVLGLENKQALIVQHLDTEHPHVHVIVNRVDPESGIASNLSYSKKDLSRWAKEYEQNNVIRCEGRFKKEKQVDLTKEENTPPVSDKIISPEAQEEKQTKQVLESNSLLSEIPQELPQKLPESLYAADKSDAHNATSQTRVKEYIKSVQNWTKDRVLSIYHYLSRAKQNEQQKEEQQQQQQSQHKENTR